MENAGKDVWMGKRSNLFNLPERGSITPHAPEPVRRAPMMRQVKLIKVVKSDMIVEVWS